MKGVHERLGSASAAGLLVAVVAACGSVASPTVQPSQSSVPTASATATPATTTFAKLEGVWALTFTITGYTGPDAGASVAYPKGTVQRIAWNFQSTCNAQGCQAFGGTTTVTVPGESTSFSPTNAFSFTFMSTTPLASSGTGPYAGQYPGSLGCGTENVSLTVTASTHRADGPHATSLQGSDVPVADGACPNVEYVVMQVSGTQVQDATPNP